MITFDGSENIIDSRDVIERLEHLQNNKDDLDDCELEEFAELEHLVNECGNFCDWEHGAALINDSHFEEYMDEMIEDCYGLPKDLPSFMTITLDYDWIRMDYASVDFMDNTFWIRNC